MTSKKGPAETSLARERELIQAARQDALGAGIEGESAPPPQVPDHFPPQPLPDSFPGYKITREVHRGGQGVVYQAIQKATRRKVAIKVMREGPFASARDKARFEREVRILGLLNHANIVAIHDTGTAGDNCYYYVMDYISGQPLDVYMAGAERSIDDTLRLLCKICAAVNEAHLRGVIHRDLKPGNILIDANGEPHVLDFGLAKVAMGALTDESQPQVMTVTGQFIGSLPWASPEQATGNPDKIDVRTDVYALGVVLYQMLTGRFPYQVAGDMRDVLNNIVTVEPVKPSTIRRRINDEVETMVLKCLKKDPERRYQSAGELARDIRRYLAGEPIEAKRDSSLYVLRKTLRRHKGPMGVAASFFVLLVGFGSALWTMHSRANAAEHRALQAQLAFLQQAFARTDAKQVEGHDRTIREALDDAAPLIDKEYIDQPEAEAKVRDMIGQFYRALGEYEAALPHLERALDIRHELFGDEHAEIATSLHNLAATHWYNGDYTSAEPLYREALDMRRELFGDEHVMVANSLNHLAACLNSKGDLTAAEKLYRQVLEMRRGLLGPEHLDIAFSLNNLATCLLDRGVFEGAEGLFREAVDMARKLGGDEYPYIAAGLTNLAACRTAMGNFEEAETLLERAMVMKRDRLGVEHPSVAVTLHRQAELMYAKGNYAAAEALCGKALDLRRTILRTDHPRTAESLTLLGMILLAGGDAEGAQPLLADALEIWHQELPADHWRTARTQSVLGSCLTTLRRFKQAEPLLLKSYPIIKDTRGERDRDTQEALTRIVELYEAWGKDADAADHRAMLAEPDPAME